MSARIFWSAIGKSGKEENRDRPYHTQAEPTRQGVSAQERG